MDRFLVVLPWVVIFGLIPLELYNGNKKAFSYQSELLLGPLAVGLVVCLVLLLVYQYLSRSKPGWAQRLALGSALLGFSVWFCDVLAPLQLGPQDGAFRPSTEAPIYTVIELVIMGVLGFLTLRFTQQTTKVFQSLSRYSLVIFFGYCLVVFLIHTPPQQNQFKSALSRELPNIYHFHLDGLQTDYFLEIVKEMDLEDTFSGTTVFQQNTANYPNTVPSVASYMTGSLFDYRDGVDGGTVKERYQEWLGNFDQGIFKQAVDQGYRLGVYTSDRRLWSPLAHDYIDGSQAIFENHQFKISFEVDFMRAWIGRLVPNFLSNEGLEFGEALAFKLFPGKAQQYDSSLYPATINQGLQQFQGVALLKSAGMHEAQRPAYGNYVFVHAIIPHIPYVYNRSCSLDPSLDRLPLRESYLEQARCVVGLLADLVQQLKAQGKYEDSLIVLHSDHGTGHAGFLKEAGEPDSDPGFDLQARTGMRMLDLRTRTMALLAVKKPHSQGQLVIDRTTPSQLLDLLPTVFGDAAAPPGSLAVDLFGSSSAKLQARPRIITTILNQGNQSSDFTSFAASFDERLHTALRETQRLH